MLQINCLDFVLFGKLQAGFSVLLIDEWLVCSSKHEKSSQFNQSSYCVWEYIKLQLTNFFFCTSKESFFWCKTIFHLHGVFLDLPPVF